MDCNVNFKFQTSISHKNVKTKLDNFHFRKFSRKKIFLIGISTILLKMHFFVSGRNLIEGSCKVFIIDFVICYVYYFWMLSFKLIFLPVKQFKLLFGNIGRLIVQNPSHRFPTTWLGTTSLKIKIKIRGRGGGPRGARKKS